jgi:hypothetical protein
VLQCIINECNNAIESTGGHPEDYIVKAYPFSIERKDNKLISREVLQEIERRLKKVT